MHSGPRILIVGGGISGLSSAHYLHRRLGDDVQITLIEAAPRLGGKIATVGFGGHAVDVGPDALMVRSPVVAALITELGLDDQLVAPNPGGARIWSRGKLRPLPAGTLFGIPDRLLPLLRSGLLSPAGVARAALDIVLPRRRPRSAVPSADPTIADLVRPRMGDEVFDRLVDPLLGGVHAGRADELSARSTAPDIEAVARTNRSLYLALGRRRRAAPPKTGGAALVTLQGGLATLIDSLAARLANDDIRLGSPAKLITRTPAGYSALLADGTSIEADAVVLATSAAVAADLLGAESPALAAALADVPYVDVATVCLAYPRSATPTELAGTGFLVPPVEDKLVVGCTWSSAKWPHLADDELVLIRCMVGRRGDTRWLGLDDDTLVDLVHADLVEAMGLTERPIERHIERWPQGMPQYVVGHQARLDAAAAALLDLPGIRLTGSSYRGVGLASCIVDAERTADALADQLTGDRARTEVAS